VIRRQDEQAEAVEELAERAWLVEVPTPSLPDRQEGEGKYAALIRRLDEDNGHIMYSGDTKAATTLMRMRESNGWREARASWLLNDCTPIAPRGALAIVFTALRRDPEGTQRRFRAAKLVPGITVRRNGASVV